MEEIIADEIPEIQFSKPTHRVSKTHRYSFSPFQLSPETVSKTHSCGVLEVRRFVAGAFAVAGALAGHWSISGFTCAVEVTLL